VNGKDLPPTWSLSHVRLGEWDTAQDRDCDDSYVGEQICSEPVIDVEIEEKIPHPEYGPNANNQHNDIALLRLVQNVPFSDFIKPICLPNEPTLRQKNFDRLTMTVAGFGKFKDIIVHLLRTKK
jgi:hypothetical protein